MTEAELTRALANAGLEYLGTADRDACLLPPRLAAYASSTAADGDEWAVSVENNAQDFQQRVNHEWYMLSAHQGLFETGRPEFLLAVPDPDRHGDTWWARVALGAEWDLAGSGAAAHVTGHGWGHPEFLMLSRTGDVVVQGTQGQEWTDVVALRNPHRISSFRAMGVSLLENTSITPPTREAVERWLAWTAA
ncbi:hypothetical protein [Streptomyces sp. NPDC049915]|uniref:hypothetical protein n=1 Tax=Streptomyces sp. NPDC049915 TaxID=3155510 RepID=UPI003428D006